MITPASPPPHTQGHSAQFRERIEPIAVDDRSYTEPGAILQERLSSAMNIPHTEPIAVDDRSYRVLDLAVGALVKRDENSTHRAHRGR